MKVERNLEVHPPHTEETYAQLQWKNKETMYEEHPMHGEVPMQEEMEQHQEEHAKQLEQVLQNQERQEKSIDRLKDLYENPYEQQTAFNQQYTEKMASIKNQLEALWVNVIPHPPLPPPFVASSAPPRLPYRVLPY
ncbi:hypothetical protein Acr_00g0011470 [Actinidia rufa]|uniref:Uncharacterized protein n=1 Tax=Actinidia rufa TaxID=165716 RepID=A0A7J0DA36_9ERIC|nr:hypothetical protein Acr_00g0011470 [Actinidia rufa]